jgi:hypothetical protein
LNHGIQNHAFGCFFFILPTTALIDDTEKINLQTTATGMPYNTIRTKFCTDSIINLFITNEMDGTVYICRPNQPRLRKTFSSL